MATRRRGRVNARRGVQWVGSQQLDMYGNMFSHAPGQTGLSIVVNAGVSLATILNVPEYTHIRFVGSTLIVPRPFEGAVASTTAMLLEVVQALGFFPTQQSTYPDLFTDRDCEQWFYFRTDGVTFCYEESAGGQVVADQPIREQVQSKAMRKIVKTSQYDLVWKCQINTIAGVFNDGECQVFTSGRFLVKLP